MSAPIETDDDNYVFLICQIGDKGSPERRRADEVYEHVVEVAASAHGLRVMRSDLEPTPGRLTTQIVRGIINARAIVGDLTGRNPNVFYELGVCHAFARPVVLLVKDPKSLPFDVQDERTIAIGDDDKLGVSEAKEAARALELALGIVLAPDYVPSNLVTEVAAAQSLDALAPQNPIAAEMATIRERVEDQSALMREFLTRFRPSGRSPDYARIRWWVETMVETAKLEPRDLDRLPDDTTSSAFDGWVAQLRERLNELENAALRDQYEEGYDDEPF